MLKAEIGISTVYYTRGFELISRREGTAASYYVYDGVLSVRALTNETGTVTDTLVFDSFGNETTKTGSSDNPYGFQGEEQDETGLYYLRARYMDPATGTFTTMDTYGGSLSDPMSLHKYLFANSNPVMYSDPSGHYTLSQQETTIAMVLTLAVAVSYMYTIAAKLIASNTSSIHTNKFGTIAGLLNVLTTAAKSLDYSFISKAAKEIVKAISTAVTIASVSTGVRCYEVYLIPDKENGDIVYVGRTKNWDFRKHHHEQTKSNYCNVEQTFHIVGLTYEESRILEQSLMAYYHTKNALKEINPSQLNLINGIGPNNHQYDNMRTKWQENLEKYAENLAEEEYLMAQEVLMWPWY